jgi:hypothetical protein
MPRILKFRQWQTLVHECTRLMHTEAVASTLAANFYLEIISIWNLVLESFSGMPVAARQHSGTDKYRFSYLGLISLIKFGTPFYSWNFRIIGQLRVCRKPTFPCGLNFVAYPCNCLQNRLKETHLRKFFECWQQQGNLWCLRYTASMSIYGNFFSTSRSA